MLFARDDGHTDSCPLEGRLGLPVGLGVRAKARARVRVRVRVRVREGQLELRIKLIVKHCNHHSHLASLHHHYIIIVLQKADVD